MGARVYLDHAATTPMLPDVRETWLRQSELLGNPNSLHASGRAARRAVEEARESIAADLDVRPSAVVFTSGGTEADNLAIKGLYWSRRDPGRPGRVLCSAVEHHAVLDPVRWLAEHEGADVVWLPVDEVGRVQLEALEQALEHPDDVALCTVMWANNEVGTVQPVAAIGEMCRAAGVPFHTDAVQAVGHLPVHPKAVGARAATVSGHKIGGPFGVGALLLDPRLNPTPVLHGGGQEREIRSGTLDAPGIAAFATAVHHAVTGQAARAERLAPLRDSLAKGILDAVPGAIVNGDTGSGPAARLPGNMHVTFPGCEGDLLLMLLDAAGIDCSTGSACSAGIPEPSHVLLAIGADTAHARSSLRFSLGEASSQADVDAVVAALPGAVDRARRAGLVAARQAG